MPTFDKMAQWQKKPNNMKKMVRENSKVKPSGQNGGDNGQQAHKNNKWPKRSKWVEEAQRMKVVNP